MELRPGRIADLAAINRVELSAGTLFEGTHMAWAVGDTTPRPKLRKAVDNETLWVASVDAELAGFLLAEAIDRDFHIWELSVSRAYQGRGIGSALVETAVAEAARRGLVAVTLTTDRTLPWNAPFYQKLGFAILSVASIPLRLAKQLASETQPHRRCAMRRAVAQP